MHHQKKRMDKKITRRQQRYTKNSFEITNEWTKVPKYVRYSILKRVSECESSNNFKTQYHKALEHYITSTIVYNNITSPKDVYECKLIIARAIKFLFEKAEGLKVFQHLMNEYKRHFPLTILQRIKSSQIVGIDKQKQLAYTTLKNLCLYQIEKEIKIIT